MQEWVTDSNPTNARSCLRLLPSVPNGADLQVQWVSVPTRRYFLEYSTNLTVSQSFLVLATNIAGQAETTSYTHTNAMAAPSGCYYRVGIQHP